MIHGVAVKKIVKRGHVSSDFDEILPGVFGFHGVGSQQQQKPHNNKKNLIKRGHVSTDIDKILRGVVVFHGVAVFAGSSNVVMVVILQGVVDSINTVETAGVLRSSSPAEIARPQHDSLSVALEYAPGDFLFGCDTLIAAHFDDGRAYARDRYARIRTRNRCRFLHRPPALSTYEHAALLHCLHRVIR